eukprot:s2041_g4.t1
MDLFEGGQRVYPSKEVAKYKAALAYAIALAASWWAVRMGIASLQVPGMPTFITLGRREHWLDIGLRAFREWAAVPFAASLASPQPCYTRQPSGNLHVPRGTTVML